MNARNLLAYLQRRSRRAEEPPRKHLPAREHAADPGACDRVSPPVPKPEEPSPTVEPRVILVDPKPTRRRTRRTAPYTTPPPLVVRSRALGRADLAKALDSQLKADQALWAPDMLAPADRKTAEEILRRFR